ncbi:hypothetical protein D3C81_1151110 [compost metagenome]
MKELIDNIIVTAKLLDYKVTFNDKHGIAVSKPTSNVNILYKGNGVLLYILWGTKGEEVHFKTKKEALMRFREWL